MCDRQISNLVEQKSQTDRAAGRPPCRNLPVHPECLGHRLGVARTFIFAADNERDFFRLRSRCAQNDGRDNSRE